MILGDRKLVGANLSNPEVENLNHHLSAFALGEEHVCRLDVAMNDACFMRALKADAGLRHDPEYELGRQRRRD